MSVEEVSAISDSLLPVDTVTRFSDSVFDIIAQYKNYMADGKCIRPPAIFNNIRNERQLYAENIAFYFIDNKLTAINIYHMDVNSSTLSRDDIVRRYGSPRRYQWKNETNDGHTVLELFTGDSGRYIVLQSSTQDLGGNIKITLKHLTFIDRKWIDEKLKNYFEEYDAARNNTAKRLLD
ncbi:MAG: hypothetical protein LBO65_07615 [Spirochaetaceae bacterium]|jgi:hypothetical protein|nr:hypothetical protein [Spirochaetaceae bacterium]